MKSIENVLIEPNFDKFDLKERKNEIQAALVVRGFGIQGFDYSRTQKPRIMMENFYFKPNLC